MVIKRDDPRTADVLPWEPQDWAYEIEIRWYRGAYPWEEENDD